MPSPSPMWISHRSSVCPCRRWLALANIVRSFFTRAAILAVGVLLFQRLRKRWMIAVVAIASACAMVNEAARTPAEFALEFVPALVAVACVLAFCVWFARSNYLAYVLVLTIGAVYDTAAELRHTAVETQGWIVLGLVFVGFVWLVGTGLVRRPIERARLTCTGGFCRNRVFTAEARRWASRLPEAEGAEEHGVGRLRAALRGPGKSCGAQRFQNVAVQALMPGAHACRGRDTSRPRA